MSSNHETNLEQRDIARTTLYGWMRRVPSRSNINKKSNDGGMIHENQKYYNIITVFRYVKNIDCCLRYHRGSWCQYNNYCYNNMFMLIAAIV